MKRMNNYTATEKWGLFALLIATLGFNLSMDPNSFNEIARNEHSMQTMDLAATDASAKVETKTDSGKKEMLVAGKKNNFNAKIFQVEGSTFVRFEALGDTEAKACELCNAGAMPLKSKFDNLADIKNEVLGIVSDKEGSKSSSDSIDSKSDEKKTYEIADWAKKCQDSKADDELSCHKDRLIKLSKDLKNDSASEKVVLSYLKKYILADLGKLLFRPTVHEVDGSDCDSNVAYRFLTNRGPNVGKVGCMSSENFEAGQEIISDLVKGLQSVNGRSSVDLLLKVQTGAFAKQLDYSKTMGKEADIQQEMEKRNNALRSLDFTSEKNILNDSYDRLASAIDSSSMTDKEKRHLTAMLDVNFKRPVRNLYAAQMEYQLGLQGPDSARKLFDFPIADVGTKLGSSAGRNVVDNSNSTGDFTHRSGETYRGSNLPPIGGMGWNSQPRVYNPNLPVTTNFQPPQQNVTNSPFNTSNSNGATTDLGRSAFRVR